MIDSSLLRDTTEESEVVKICVWFRDRPQATRRMLKIRQQPTTMGLIK